MPPTPAPPQAAPPDANTPPPPGPATVDSPPPAQVAPLNLPTGIASTLPDQFETMTGGGVKITCSGRIFNLRKPNMPEFLALRNAFQAIVDEDRKYRAEHDDVARDQTEEILGWVDQACVMLADAGITSLPDTEVPPWLGSAVLVNDMLSHWREVPYRK